MGTRWQKQPGGSQWTKNNVKTQPFLANNNLFKGAFSFGDHSHQKLTLKLSSKLLT